MSFLKKRFYSKLCFADDAPNPSSPKKLEGYAYKWGDKGFADGMPETIQKGAFQGGMNEDTMLYMNHDPKKILGRLGKNMSLEEDDVGLKFEVELPDTQEAKDAHELVKAGIIDGVSVGMDDFKEEFEGDMRIIKSARLGEISITQKPVYKETEVMARQKGDRLYPPEVY